MIKLWLDTTLDLIDMQGEITMLIWVGFNVAIVKTDFDRRRSKERRAAIVESGLCRWKTKSDIARYMASEVLEPDQFDEDSLQVLTFEP
jgi:hypothetical protein